MKKDNLSTYIFFSLLLLSFWLLGNVLMPYISTIVISLVMAVLSYPLYLRINKFVKYKGLASLFTMLLVFIVTFVPLSIFGALIVRESGDLINKLQGGGLSSFSSFHAMASFLIGLILFYYLLKDGNNFKKQLIEKSPLGKENTSNILKRFTTVVHSVIRGNIVIALIQGVLVGVGFTIFGVPNAALWAGVATIMALIPAVGTAIVLLGGVAFVYTHGTPLMMLGLILWSGVVVGLIDDTLRPYLIGRGSNIHPMLILLSVVGGLSAFGPVGFILGPIILSLFIVVFEIYPVMES